MSVSLTMAVVRRVAVPAGRPIAARIHKCHIDPGQRYNSQRTCPLVINQWQLKLVVKKKRESTNEFKKLRNIIFKF